MSFYFKSQVIDRLANIEKMLDGLTTLMEEFKMSVSTDITDLAQKIDDATNKVAAEIAAMQGQIKNSMTDAEVSAVKTRLQAVADRLTVLGQDPNNPVP